MEFSNFDRFAHWDFVREALPSPEEQEERGRQAVYDFLRTMGAEPLSRPRRLLELLESLEDVVLESDAVGKRVFGTQCADTSVFSEMIQNRPIFAGPLSENTLFRAFISLARRFSGSNPGEDQYVVTDVKSNSPTGDMYNDLLLSTLFLVLPQWQLEKGITGISWSFETHLLFQKDNVFSSSLWEVTTDTDSLLAKNRHALAFYHDDMRIVADIANAMAEHQPDTLVVRILRAAGGTGSTGFVPEIASMETPMHMITLWIREDLASQGTKFNDHRPGSVTLVDQLTDYKELSFLERMEAAGRWRADQGSD
jgi:hypothetical protein